MNHYESIVNVSISQYQNPKISSRLLFPPCNAWRNLRSPNRQCGRWAVLGPGSSGAVSETHRLEKIRTIIYRYRLHQITLPLFYTMWDFTIFLGSYYVLSQPLWPFERVVAPFQPFDDTIYDFMLDPQHHRQTWRDRTSFSQAFRPIQVQCLSKVVSCLIASLQGGPCCN